MRTVLSVMVLLRSARAGWLEVLAALGRGGSNTVKSYPLRKKSLGFCVFSLSGVYI